MRISRTFLNAESAFFISRDPRVMLQRDIPYLRAISLCVVPASSSFTRCHLFEKSFSSAAVKRQPKNSFISFGSSIFARRPHISAIASTWRLHSSFCCYLLLCIRHWWRIRRRRYPTLKTLMTSTSTQPISEKKISRVKFIRAVDPLEKETPQVLLKQWNEALLHIYKIMNANKIK